MINEFKLTENFKLSEFDCKCCNTVKLDSVLVEMLQKLRSRYGKGLTVISGYRCLKHNKAVGGAKDSYHMHGNAVDIKPSSKYSIEDLQKLCKLAHEIGFRRIGIYPDDMMVHVDNGKGERYWIKRAKQDYQYFDSLDAII